MMGARHYGSNVHRRLQVLPLSSTCDRNGPLSPVNDWILNYKEISHHLFIWHFPEADFIPI